MSIKKEKDNLDEERELDRIRDTVKFDNDIDLDRERTRKQLGFTDEKRSFSDVAAEAERKAAERRNVPGHLTHYEIDREKNELTK